MENETIDGGYIIISRQILDSDIWYKSPAYLKIFLYILAKVNYKKGKLDVGEGFFNFRREKIPGVTLSQIYEFLRWAKSENTNQTSNKPQTILTTQKTTRGTIIKVNNYARYQEQENYKNQHTYQHTTNTQPTNFQHYNKNKKQEESSINLSLSNNMRIGKREREILKTYCKKNNVQNANAYIRKLIDSGDAAIILEEEKIRLEKLEKRKQESVQEIGKPENSEETEKAFQEAKKVVQMIFKKRGSNDITKRDSISGIKEATANKY